MVFVSLSLAVFFVDSFVCGWGLNLEGLFYNIHKTTACLVEAVDYDSFQPTPQEEIISLLKFFFLVFFFFVICHNRHTLMVSLDSGVSMVLFFESVVLYIRLWGKYSFIF